MERLTESPLEKVFCESRTRRSKLCAIIIACPTCGRVGPPELLVSRDSPSSAHFIYFCVPEGEHFPDSHRLFSSQTCSRSFQVGCNFI